MTNHYWRSKLRLHTKENNRKIYDLWLTCSLQFQSSFLKKKKNIQLVQYYLRCYACDIFIIYCNKIWHGDRSFSTETKKLWSAPTPQSASYLADYMYRVFLSDKKKWSVPLGAVYLCMYVCVCACVCGPGIRFILGTKCPHGLKIR